MIYMDYAGYLKQYKESVPSLKDLTIQQEENVSSMSFTNINLHKNDVATTIIPMLQIKILNTKRISNLLKVTQFISGKAGIKPRQHGS